MTSHDVRHLRVCQWCGDLGDERAMVATGPRDLAHGRCAIVVLGGVEGLLTLPQSELDKLTLGDIGPEIMRRLLDARQGAV